MCLCIHLSLQITQMRIKYYQIAENFLYYKPVIEET